MLTRELFTDIWRRLQDEGDKNNDGKITAEEWVSDQSAINEIITHLAMLVPKQLVSET